MGAQLGPFWLNRRLAGGRTGEVWTGVHRDQDVQVAVKFLTVRKGEAAFREVFRREVEILATLDHPNIVRIWDHGTVSEGASARLGGEVRPGAPYLVMEQGRATLGDRKAQLPWSSVRKVAIDLLGALAHAHARGLLHRDIKPGNVLLCPAERAGEQHRVVLTDFGFGGPSGEETLVVGLTPAYAAPEQLTFEARDEGPWTDLFGLGGVLWELLTGEAPYQADTIAAALDAHERTLPRLEGVPGPVEAWLRGLLALAPVARPPSAVAALQALAAAEGGSPDPSEVPSDWRVAEVRPAGPRHLAGVGLGLVGLRAGSVARDRERDTLWACVRAARVGRASAVVLTGPEGIGKTHLVRWLATTAHERAGATALEVGTDGLVGALRRHVRLEGLDGRAARSRIAAWLGATGGAGWFEAGAVHRLLGGGPAGPEAFARLAGLVRRAAGDRPLVVAIDGDDAVDASADFVAHVLTEHPDWPVVFALATRQAPALELPPRSIAELQLGPLDPPATERLLRAHLGLAQDLRAELADACRGNPGVAQRLLRRFAEDGGLQVDAEGRWYRP